MAVPTPRLSLRPGTVAVTAAALALAWYLVPRLATLSPRYGAGLGFGVLSAFAFTIPMTYPLRRLGMAWPMRHASDWWRVHVIAGAMAFPCALLHQGVRLPAGLLGWMMMALGLWATAFGLLAVVLQRRLPALQASARLTALPPADVGAAIERLRAEAEALAADASPGLAAWYAQRGRPAFAREGFAWQRLIRRRRPSEGFIDDAMPAADRDRALAIHRLAEDARRLEAWSDRQWALRCGVLIHVPPAIVLLALIAFHLFAVWYF